MGMVDDHEQKESRDEVGAPAEAYLPGPSGGPEDPERLVGAGGTGEAGEKVSPIWAAMASLVGIDFLLGIGAIVAVPYGRASAWLPTKGEGVYLAHGVIGAILGVGALYLVVRFGSAPERMARLAARTGIIGIAVGVVGGILTVYHPLRLVGMALMLLGSMAAGIGYLMPSLEAHDQKERAELARRYEEETGEVL